MDLRSPPVEPGPVVDDGEVPRTGGQHELPAFVRPGDLCVRFRETTGLEPHHLLVIAVEALPGPDAARSPGVGTATPVSPATHADVVHAVSETAERAGASIAGTSDGRLMAVTAEIDPRPIEVLAAEILASLRQASTGGSGTPRVVGSVGIARTDSGSSEQQAFADASEALEWARSEGRDRYAWHDRVGFVDVTQRLDLVRQLRDAIGRDELQVHLSPVFGLGTGSLAGLQARPGWQHPVLGWIDPRRLDLRDPELDALLAAHALREGVELLGAGYQGLDDLGRPPRLWIPVQRHQVSGDGFARGLLSHLRSVGVEPDRLTIEVDETALIGHGGPEFRELASLSHVGVRIAVAGEGVGAGLLSRLHAWPVDVLAIDGGLIANVGRAGGPAAVSAIVALAHALEASVMAGGVATVGQLRDLRRAGFDLVAGPALADAVPVAELDRSVRRGSELLHAERRGGVATAVSRRGERRRRKRRSGTGGMVRRRRDPSPAVETDALTGLGSRRGAHAALREHLSDGRRPVLILIDLDGFMAFRLMRDQEAADVLLRLQARRLVAVAGADAYRLRDDLFALILPDGRRGTVATQIDLSALTQGPRGMTACVAIAQTVDGETPEQLQRRAQRALVIAKRRGDASVVDARMDQDDGSEVTAAQTRALSTLLREGYLRVQYQPIFSLADDAVLGYEALVRPRLEHGLSGIDEAFKVAGHLGLIPELDAVCRNSIFGDGPGFSMTPGSKLFVNVAPEALGHRSLRTSELRRQIVNAGLERDRVVFQLRRSPTGDPQVFATEARRFADRGFTIALADVGRGGGSLETLRDTEFTILKLAPDLMAAAREDLRAAATLEALCTFAQQADIAVIATGIESPRMLSRARTLRRGSSTRPRIHAVQGYHLGRPQPQPRAT